MKKLFLVGGIMAGFVLAAIGASASGGTNFGGTWALDKTKSQGVDPRMEKADVTCVIAQDDKTLTMEWKIAGGQLGGGPGSGSGGGGGGMGRGAGAGGPRTFNLDGKEVMSEGQMGGTSSMKATWSSDSSTLELETIRTGTRDGQEFKSTTIDKLSLSADGKVLTINRHSESPRGTTDSVLVFNKQ